MESLFSLRYCFYDYLLKKHESFHLPQNQIETPQGSIQDPPSLHMFPITFPIGIFCSMHNNLPGPHAHKVYLYLLTLVFSTAILTQQILYLLSKPIPAQLQNNFLQKVLSDPSNPHYLLPYYI